MQIVKLLALNHKAFVRLRACLENLCTTTFNPLKYLAHTILLILSLLMLSAKTPSVNPTTWIIGKWKMITVMEGNQDISPTLNPANDRWIKFNQDRTFESGNDSEVNNTGTYIVNNGARTLHIDSDAGDGDDSNWKIQFREDLLLMRGIGSARQEMTTVTSQRVLE